MNKDGLNKAIAELRAAEFIERIGRAQKTGRFSSIRGDVENPHKQGRRARELRQLDDEVTAALRARKYAAGVLRKPSLKLAPLRRITNRVLRNLRPNLSATQPDALTWYKLFVPRTNGFCLFSDGSFVKRGCDIDKAMLEDDLLGFPYELQPINRCPEITDDGAVYWTSFKSERLRVTFDIGEEVVGLLDIDRSYKLFTVVGKSPREPLQAVVEEESSEHRLTNKGLT